MESSVSNNQTENEELLTDASEENSDIVATPSATPPQEKQVPSPEIEEHQQLYNESNPIASPPKKTRKGKKKGNSIDERTLQERIEAIEYEKEMLELEKTEAQRNAKRHNSDIESLHDKITALQLKFKIAKLESKGAIKDQALFREENTSIKKELIKLKAKSMQEKTKYSKKLQQNKIRERKMKTQQLKLDQQVKELTQERNELQSELDETRSRLEEIERIRILEKERHASADIEMRGEIENLKRDADAVKIELDELKIEMNQSQEFLRVKTLEIESKDATLRQYEHQIDELNKKMNDITSNVKSREDKHKEIRRELKKSRTKSEKLQNEIFELKKEVAGKYALKVEIKKLDTIHRKLNDEIKHLRKENIKVKNKSSDVDEKCSSLKKDLTSQIRRYQDFEKRTKTKEEIHKEELKKALDAVETTQTLLEQRENELQETKSMLTNSEKEHELTKQEAQKLYNQLYEVCTQESELQNENQALNDQIESLKGKLKKAEKQRSSAETKLKKQSLKNVKPIKSKQRFNKEDFMEVKKNLRLLNKANADLQNKVKNLEIHKKTLERQLSQIKSSSEEKISRLFEEKDKLKKRCIRLQKKIKISDSSPAVNIDISQE
jgi:chromosome segregation ATPase